MDCARLARRIESLMPGAGQDEIARWCAVLLNIAGPSGGRLDDESGFVELWNEAHLRVHAAHDQHEATLAELDQLARSDPRRFSPDQIWILVRALKVQGQLLQLYARLPESRAAA